MYVEDLDLRPDDEHARVHGKGGTVRTVPLDDRGYVTLLRLYLARPGYASGPLFRVSINGRGGPLSHDAAHSRRKKYCAAAGVGIGIYQLRHAHASELINSAVSHRGDAPPPGPPLRRDHPGLHPARRPGCRRRDPRRTPQTRDGTPVTRPADTLEAVTMRCGMPDGTSVTRGRTFVPGLRGWEDDADCVGRWRGSCGERAAPCGENVHREIALIRIGVSAL